MHLRAGQWQVQDSCTPSMSPAHRGPERGLSAIASAKQSSNAHADMLLFHCSRCSRVSPQAMCSLYSYSRFAAALEWMQLRQAAVNSNFHGPYEQSVQCIPSSDGQNACMGHGTPFLTAGCQNCIPPCGRSVLTLMLRSAQSAVR